MNNHTVLLCCSLLPLAAPAQSKEAAPASATSRPSNGREILEGALAHYRALPELACEGEVDPLLPKEALAQLPDADDMADQMRVRFSAALKGDRCAFRMTAPVEQSLVCDGKHVLRSVAMLSIYERKPFAKAFDAKGLAEDPFGIPGAAVVLALRAPASAPESLAKAARVDVLGDEDVGKVPCHHLAVQIDDERKVELWIRRGAAPWVERWREEGRLPAMPDLKGPPRVIEIPVVPGVDCRFTKQAPATGAEKFSAEAPPGLEKVEDLGKAIEERMGGGESATAGAPPAFPAEAPDVVGKPAPEVTLELLDGTKQPLAELRGKVVVLDFWATWCKPCVAALPVVARVAAKFAKEGVVLQTVDSSEPKQRIMAHLEKESLDVPVALDRGGKLAAKLGVTGVPHLFVIGRDGTVRASHIGSDPGLEEWLTKELKAALK